MNFKMTQMLRLAGFNPNPQGVWVKLVQDEDTIIEFEAQTVEDGFFGSPAIYIYEKGSGENGLEFSSFVLQYC